jgi:hypothetical protein
VPDDTDTLARYQAALLDILWRFETAEDIAAALAAEPACAPYRDYVRRMDPRMLETAAALTRKWGRRGHRAE